MISTVSNPGSGGVICGAMFELFVPKTDMAAHATLGRGQAVGVLTVGGS